MHEQKLTIIIPAYNVEASIQDVVEGLRELYNEQFAEIIVVNDGSTDNTAGILSRIPQITVITHKHNFGYGASVKIGICNAAAELVCLFDGDGQHDQRDVMRLYNRLLEDDADMVVGNRGSSAFTSDFKRGPGKLVLHVLANFISEKPIPDLNSGLRILKRDILKQYIQILPDGFSLSSTSTLIFNTRNYELGYADISTKPRLGTSTVNQLKDGFATIKLIFRVLFLFNPLKFFISLSMFFILGGIGYGLFKFSQPGGYLSIGSIIIIFLGIESFIIGMLSDQISNLRIERLESASLIPRIKNRSIDV